MPVIEKFRSARLKLSARLFAAHTLARALASDSNGATAVEYSLLASFIAVTIAGICGMMFAKLSSEYGEITNIFT